MRNVAGGAVGLLRRLFGASAPAAATPHAGTPGPHVLGEALAALEGAICEGVVNRPASTARATDLRLEPALNAFGRPLRELDGSGARGCVATATGLALTGQRATCAVAGSELFEVSQALRTAAARLAPLVVHAALDDGHAGWHAAAETGAFLALARDGQEAMDLTLLARWLAERALVPGLVGVDGDAVERLALPGDALVRDFLGEPGATIAVPNDAQRLLFGAERRRVVRWFDLDHPVATGGSMGAADASHAGAGREVLFSAGLLPLAKEGMAALAKLTGRPLSFVRKHRLDDAEQVLVAQGALVQAAEAVAEQLRAAKGLKVGVLGVTWLRPFPSAEVAAALKGRGAVAVLERGCTALGDGPLLREVAAAAGGRDGRWISAVASGPAAVTPARLAALCELLRKADRPASVRLDLEPVAAATGFPHRDAALNALKAAAPGMGAALPAVAAAPSAPEGGVAVGLLALEAELPKGTISALGEELAKAAGPALHGTVSRPWPGVVEARLRAAAADFAEPGPGAPVDVLLVAAATPVGLGPSLAPLKEGATLVFSTDEDPERVWGLFPGGWRKAVEAQGLKVALVRGGLGAARATAIALARGQEAKLAVPVAASAAALAVDRELPQVVRRVGAVRVAMDSLPRHYGEVVQPRQGGVPDGVADVLLAAGTVPGGASALQLPASAATLPELKVDACTGCGRCWSACPDSAFCVAAVSPEALLTAASKQAGTTGKPADALRRAHKQLNGYFGGELCGKGHGAFTRARVEAGWAWLSGTVKPPDAERAAYESATLATTREAVRHQAVVTRPFFEGPEAQRPGSGELLVLAVDPRACVGCALCVAACPEQALASVPRTAERVAKATAAFKAWEGLPDTAGATIARVEQDPAVGPLAATLLARSCAQAQVGDVEGEPGAGERLATRLVAALAERHAQGRVAALAKAVEERRTKLEEKARAQLTTSVSAADMASLATALGGGATMDLAALGKGLDALGISAKIDARAVKRLAGHAAELAALRAALVSGADGLGRARYGVAVLGESAATWAGRFPSHPWFAPLAVELSAEGAELARGLAWGLLAGHVELVKALRKAELLEEGPPDLDPRLSRLESLSAAELTPGERDACPPLLVLTDEAALTERGLGTLSRLLESPLPIKVVLLDGLSRLGGRAPVDLVALAHQRAFVLATSLAHGAHLAKGVEAALAHPGAALIHVHAPSPRRHGFPADRTLDRARAAVEARAQVLLKYNPAAPGVFGTRAVVTENPAAGQPWGSVDFVTWASGEGRFAPHFALLPEEAAAMPVGDWLKASAADRAGKAAFVERDGKKWMASAPLLDAADERLAAWTALQELTGLSNPFVDRTKEQLLKELQAAHDADLAALRAEYEGKLAAVKATTDQELVGRVTDRLMSIAGYARPGERS